MYLVTRASKILLLKAKSLKESIQAHLIIKELRNIDGGRFNFRKQGEERGKNSTYTNGMRNYKSPHIPPNLTESKFHI